RQLVTKVNANVPVHRGKRAAVTIVINDSLQLLWNDYKGGAVSLKELLLESSKWGARKAGYN
ncbi:unnamed protein product, partial [Rotaria sp. Silwood1]